MDYTNSCRTIEIYCKNKFHKVKGETNHGEQYLNYVCIEDVARVIMQSKKFKSVIIREDFIECLNQ